MIMNEKVKQALENFKCIKEDLDYFQPKDLVCTNREEQYKSVENALNDFDRYYESQQDLIKSKDEYIAKLCCDRAELKEHEKELIAEQHRLFDLAKEQENEIKELKDFARIMASRRFIVPQLKDSMIMFYDVDKRLSEVEFDLVKKVVEKYGK